MPAQYPPDIPGPMGGNPAPGNPPTAQNPAPVNQNTQGAIGILGGYNTDQQNILNQNLAQQQGLGLANQQITDQNLQNQLNNTLAALGIQQTGLGQQGAYQQGTYQLQNQGLQQALANLQANYGFQQQQFGLQGLENQQAYQSGLHNLTAGDIAAGTYTTNTQKYGEGQLAQQLQNAMQQLGIQEGRAAQGFKYGQQGIANQQAQLGLTNTYQQQQLQNALAQLGLSKTEAGQQYTTGTQSAANQYADVLNSIALQQMSGTQNLGSVLSQLMTAGMFTGG